MKKYKNYSDNDIIEATGKGFKNKVASLLKSGVNVDSVDTSNKTPLMYAIIHRYLTIVDILLKGKANVNHQDIFLRTPLMHCSTKKIMNKLLEYGADVNLVDKNGDNVVMVYAYMDILDLDTLKSFISHGLNLDYENKGENIYDILVSSINQNIAINKKNLIEIKEYMDIHYPKYKEEFELKTQTKKYNL